MPALLYRLGRLCGRRARIVLAVWIVVVAGLVALGAAAGHQTSDDLSLPGTGSTQATDLLTAKLPNQANGSNPLVIQAPEGEKVTGSKHKDAIEQTVTAVRAVPHVTKAVNPFGQNGAALISKDQTIAYIPVTLDVGPSDLTEDEAQQVLDAGAPATAAGLDVSLGGYAGQQLSKPDTEISEAIGLAAAVVILLFAFGTVTAMALPIVTAILGLVSTLALISVLGLVLDVPSIAPTLATMIGLGVGIDYALFIVTRHKQQLRDGMEMGESIARATATAGGAVVFAGTTVVIALVSLLLAGIPLVTNLGLTAGVAVGGAGGGAPRPAGPPPGGHRGGGAGGGGGGPAPTLLPALLGVLGPRIDALRVPLGRAHPDDHHPHGWARWARGVVARPWRSLVAATVVLAVLAIPVLQLELGQNDVGAMPESTTARQAYDGMAAGFGPGSNGPLLVAAQLGTPAKPAADDLTDNPATDPRLTKLSKALAGAHGVASVSPPTLDKAGDTALFTVVSTSAPSSDATSDLVVELRDTTIPKATKGTDVTASVGGQTAAYIDLADRISDKLPQMIGVVVGLSFIVLMLAFRSLLVPAKAALMNLLSVAAAYGVVTFVFQEGHGASLIGLDEAVPIVSFVPLLMFAILFGLSMDYEVFLMTQIQERYHQTRRPTRAVVDGLAGTGRVITSAALIMVCVFASFVLDGDPIVKQFGVGLAVAIAIDATIVRCLLVPAVMTLLGRAAWWMPAWLARWLPRIDIEGEHALDRPPAPAHVG
ncbi:MAG: MMPL family transporter [Solirubrobacteraceae bacterium]|nr:MMPL family transporter [Solirubrobacteraceae bacterium]